MGIARENLSPRSNDILNRNVVLSELEFFKKISISGQDDVTATLTSNTLTLVAGTGMSITTNNTTKTITLNSTGGYTLPTASASELGGIKVGNNLTIIDGVLSATGGSSGGISEDDVIALIFALGGN